jgi:hypothetical protein
MSVLQLMFNYMPGTVNLDAGLDAICGLDQITTLYLLWEGMSLDKIKSSLRKQGGKKRWEKVVIAQIDQVMNDSDILKICSYLPSLREWSVLSPRSALTIDGARKWKRICPNLELVNFFGGELSVEVKDVLRGSGVTVN